MGFFSDLKEDLSQAVNELMPEDTQPQKEGFGDINEMLDRVDSIVVPEVMEEEAALEQSQDIAAEEPVEALTLSEESVETLELSEEPAEMLEESAEVAEELQEAMEEPVEETVEEPVEDNLEAELAAALDENVGADASEPDMDLEKMLESALAANEVNVTPVVYEEKQEPVKENKMEIKGRRKWQS